MSENHSKNGEIERAPKQLSREFSEVLAIHLKKYADIFRQPLTRIAVDCYKETLASLTPRQLDAACQRAMEISEFFPVPATILKAHEELQSQHDSGEPPNTFTDYPDDAPMTPEQREEIRKKLNEIADKVGLKRQIPPDPKPRTDRSFAFTSGPKSADQQLKEMREKGLIH